MNKRSYGYLAGMIDGDGGIYIDKSTVNGCDTYQGQLCVSNSDTRVMKWLKHHFGGCLYRNSKKGDTPNFGAAVKKQYRNNADNWQWRLTGNHRVAEAMNLLLPYLLEKEIAGRAVLALTKLHQKYRASAEREKIFAEWQLASTAVTTDKAPSFEYFAGLFDAEGSVSIVPAKSPQSFRVLLRIANDNESLLTWVGSHFGGTIYHRLEGARVRHTWYRKELNEKLLERFLLAILPYLIVKRQQANLALNLIRTSPSVRTMEACNAAREQVLLLNNSFGSVETITPACSEREQKIESELMGDHEWIASRSDNPINTLTH